MNQEQLLTPDNLNPSHIQFKPNDVLMTLQDRSERLKRLHAAMKLGNHHKHKVKLTVMSAQEQLIQIKAKVWSVTEKYVILKNSIMIPINSILDVRYT